jgi:hypothetical protein
MDKTKARDSALLQMERPFGEGSVEATEPEAELFAVAEQVDLAEKAFHCALGSCDDRSDLRSSAQIHGLAR